MKALRKGEKSLQVQRWQFFLIGQGFKNIVADKQFGKNTELATIDFQKQNGLSGDGVVGHFTYLKAMQLGFQLVEDPDDESNKGPNWPSPPDFKPLTSSQMQSLFGKIEFNIQPDKSSIKVTNNWAAQNLVTINIPFLKPLPPYKTDKITVHRKTVVQWQELFKAWEKKNLLGLIITYDGSYNPRLIRGSATMLSTHAYGIALDFNVAWNRLGALPALKGEKGSVRELVKIANDMGFFWGGHFTRKDGMHFEVAYLK